MRNLECDPKTLAGPIDKRVVKKLQKRFPLDPVYLEYMEVCHGGVPRIAAFKVGKRMSEIGLFLTLVDRRSKLPPPQRPYFEDEREDERCVNSVDYLTDGEHATSRALFGKLMPFAATLAGMCLDRANVDLLCFDCRESMPRPPVVLWLADHANSAFMDWDDVPLEDAFDEDDKPIGVPWGDFLIPVASDFTGFVNQLRART